MASSWCKGGFTEAEMGPKTGVQLCPRLEKAQMGQEGKNCVFGTGVAGPMSVLVSFFLVGVACFSLVLRDRLQANESSQI